jgi:Na+(H+)/acetate symporter ActP
VGRAAALALGAGLNATISELARHDLSQAGIQQGMEPRS